MEAFLVMNGYEIEATVDDQEKLLLGVAAGEVERPEFVAWVESHIRQLQRP